MPSPYQEFARKARERFLERQKKKAAGAGSGQYVFTVHAQHKMQQYGLSEQRVKSVIRNPRRREEGIVPKTVAVMQPPSVKRDATGKEIWTQEIWVMFQVQSTKNKTSTLVTTPGRLKIISAWRYPGVSPKRNPIPPEILRELEEGSTVEVVDEIFFSL
jgi:hypothetical protein